MKVHAYYFNCVDCNIQFFVDDQGQLDGHVGACPICESDEDVEDMGKVILDVYGR